MSAAERPAADPAGTGQPSRARLLVTRNDALSRFEGRLEGELAGVVDYFLDGGVVVITHTGTEPRWRGQGIAGELTRAALADVRRQGRQVRPVCRYTAHYLQEHPEDADLLA